MAATAVIWLIINLGGLCFRFKYELPKWYDVPIYIQGICVVAFEGSMVQLRLIFWLFFVGAAFDEGIEFTELEYAGIACDLFVYSVNECFWIIQQILDQLSHVRSFLYDTAFQ